MSDCSLYLSFPVGHCLWVSPSKFILQQWSQAQQHPCQCSWELVRNTQFRPHPGLLNQKLGCMLKLETRCQISASDLKGSSYQNCLGYIQPLCSWRNCTQVFRISSSLTSRKIKTLSSFMALYINNIPPYTLLILCCG